MTYTPGGGSWCSARSRVLLTRLVVASVLPFAAGVCFAILTEPVIATPASTGVFAGGLRDECRAAGIFRTNGLSALTLVSGVIAGGIPSVMGLAFFGRDLAAACTRAYLYGTPLPQIAAAIAPHGLLEIPALILAGAAGIGGAPLLWAFANGNRDSVNMTAAGSVVLAAVALVLLVPAAIVECHSTPIILRWTLS